MATATVTLVVTRPAFRIPVLARLPGQVACAAGFALMAGGLAGYATAQSLAGVLAPTVIWSAGNLLLSGRAFAVVTALAPPGATARYLAVYGLSWGIATVAAPVLATQVIGSLGPGALWSGCAVLCAVMSCGQPALMRAITPRPPVPTGPAPAAEPRLLTGPVTDERELPAGPSPASPGYWQARRASSASPAWRIASTGAGLPVISSTCAAAWCSSIAKPLTTTDPAAVAATASGVGHGW